MGSDYFVKISDIAVVFDGPHATPTKIDAGPYFLSISSLEKGMLDLSKSAHLSDEQFDKWTKRVTPQEGDVLFSYETRLGEAALMPAGIKACLGRRMGLLRPNREKVIPEYLLFAYLSPGFQQEIKKRTIHGATVDRIALKEFPDFNIRIPPLNEQKRVVDILNSINGKLAVNRQINQTLEQMAQALFKSWFVDFDPVVDNALDAGFFEQNSDLPEELLRRAEQRNIVREQSDFKPLPAETRQLFPAAFEECEEPSLGLGGWVPKGWKVGTLGDVLSLRNERTKPSAETQNIPYVPVECISTKEPFLSEFKSGDEAMSSLILFKKGDVLFGAMRPYFHKVCIAPFDGVTRSTVFTLTARDTESRYFSLFQAYQESTIEYATLHSEGSTIPYAKWRGSLERQPIILPTSQLQRLFHERIKLSIEWGDLNNKQSKTLSNLRDTLLPKLISGELRLSDDGTLASGNTDC